MTGASPQRLLRHYSLKSTLNLCYYYTMPRAPVKYPHKIFLRGAAGTSPAAFA